VESAIHSLKALTDRCRDDVAPLLLRVKDFFQLEFGDGRKRIIGEIEPDQAASSQPSCHLFVTFLALKIQIFSLNLLPT
jgi:hypothetical protein